MKITGQALFFLLATAFALTAAPPEGQSHFAELDGNKIHYTSYGAGDAVLAFIHGWACDETVWKAQVTELAPQFRCLTIDLPGHGQSDRPRIPYTMHLYARAIDAVLRDAGAARAILVGHSNGVPVVRQFYREFSPRARALVLVDGGLRPFADAAMIEKILAPLRGPDYPVAAGKLINSITGGIADEKLRQQIRTTMLNTPQHVAVSEFESMGAPELWKPDKINVPVLMILARQPAWSGDYEEFAHSLIPQLDYRVWDNVSHYLMMEKPAAFNDAVRDFATKLSN